MLLLCRNIATEVDLIERDGSSSTEYRVFLLVSLLLFSPTAVLGNECKSFKLYIHGAKNNVCILKHLTGI